MPREVEVIPDDAGYKSFGASLANQTGVVHFTVPDNEMCRHVSLVLGELAKQCESCRLAEKGAIVDRLEGADAPALTRLVRKYEDVSMANGDDDTTLNDRLKKLVNSAPIMLFMKGNPEQPKCGFSRQIVALLQENNATFSHFDILTDDAVREGLKTYSDWPTYPQLYIKGELVGGIDIVKEMAASGELRSMLPAEMPLNDRLASLTKQSPIMVFMKGCPDAPKCGFSKQVVQLLGKAGAKFEYFDILTDDTVRQGLKTYSDWPTYPQIYVNGELIGGLDILKEMDETGELKSALSI